MEVWMHVPQVEVGLSLEVDVDVVVDVMEEEGVVKVDVAIPLSRRVPFSIYITRKRTTKQIYLLVPSHILP